MLIVALKAKYQTVATAVRNQSGSIRLTISVEMKCMMGAATWTEAATAAEVDVKASALLNSDNFAGLQISLTHPCIVSA
jgi:hypothetical protein